MARVYDLNEQIARTDEMRAIAKAILKEGGYYAAPEHHQDGRWKQTPPSDKQLKLVRMRRGGPGFEYRIPEALYKALMIELAGQPTSKAIRTRVQAVLYLDAVNHLDPIDIQRIEGVIEAIERTLRASKGFFDEA